MAEASFLIVGGAGRLGRVVVGLLERAGRRTRVLARDPAKARAVFEAAGLQPEIVKGDLAAPETLAAALQGIERVFLLSPISETLERDQSALIAAAQAAGAARIVKISGSDWTVGTSLSGDAHAAIEKRLADSGIESVAIRPNAWAQVSLAPVLKALREGRPIPERHGAPVSYIDLRDIADVAAHQLLAPQVAAGPLVLTGGEALTIREIRDEAQRLLGRPVALAEGAGGLPAELPEFERRVIGQFYRVIAAGGAAALSPTVADLLGRPPRRLVDLLAEEISAAGAPA